MNKLVKEQKYTRQLMEEDLLALPPPHRLESGIGYYGKADRGAITTMNRRRMTTQPLSILHR